jgi:predicted nucleic acid-binding protein
MPATLNRNCRYNGQTPRSMLACLIAAVAIRHRIAILHLDKDCEVIAQYSDLISA